VAYNYLRIVPADPKLVPSPEHDQSAVAALWVLGVEVAAESSDEVRFVDPRANQGARPSLRRGRGNYPITNARHAPAIDAITQGHG
jgi:hypothetical protein